MPRSFRITVRQPSFGAVPASAVGFTQASSVMPFESASDALCGTVTIEETPSNDSAPPYPAWPPTRLAPLIDPLLPLPDESVAIEPIVSLNESASTGPAAGGAGPSDTVIATALPVTALDPPSGLCPITWPAGAALLVLVTVPTVSPAALIADCAAV